MAYQQCLAVKGGAFDIPWGVDQAFLSALAVGAKGAVGSSYNFAAPVYQRLQAAFELVRRLMEETLRRQDCLSSPQDVKRYLASRLRDAQREIFAVLFLDNRHRLLVFEELCYGTIDGATVPPRVVAQRALRHNAAALIVAHNHPSGQAEPSQADIQLTRRLRDALALVEVRLLDHIVVGDGEWVSFAERGLLS